MKVVNVHSRQIPTNIENLEPLLATLSSRNDSIWPKEKWPRMKLDNGLVQGSSGGHGPIGYFVKEIRDDRFIRFEFTKPKNFQGFHQLELFPQGENQCLVQHTIEMNAKGLGVLSWSLAVRWLHDALVEDALDKLENRFNSEVKQTQWSLWVRTLRFFLK